MESGIPVVVWQVLYFFVPAYVANMVPVLVAGSFEFLARPIDGGRSLGGVRIFGDHKTWRGILAGIVVGIVVFATQRAAYLAGFLNELALIDYAQADPLLPGFLLGLGTGVGDAVKSFFKRRTGIPPGASWLGFDQLDFMLGAYAFIAPLYAPPLLATLAILPIVFLGGVATSATSYWLGMKEAWI